MNPELEALYSDLNAMTPTEKELLLIYTYYYTYLKDPNSVDKKVAYLAKRKEFENLTSAFTLEAKSKVEKVHNKHLKKIGDLYGVVYNYVRKQTGYKQLLMLI